MILLNYFCKNFLLVLKGLVILIFLGSCGISNIYKPVDARKVSPSSQERVKKNLEEGKGFSVLEGLKGNKNTTYQFATSNPMWRATLEILDFLPLANVDYSGGIITTDWYNEGSATDESIKITIRFLTNEIRSDGLKVIVHKKKCSLQQSCSVKKISSKLQQELQVAILKKAIIYEKQTVKTKKKYKRPDIRD
jgi:hypothetical protein